MDDRSFFSSFMFNFFKPFISPHKFKNNFDHHGFEGDEDSAEQHREVAPGVSPRDSLLKPDKSKKQYVNPYTDGQRKENEFMWHWHPFGHSENDDFGTDRSENPFFDDSFSHNFDGFGDFNSMFSMMDELFERSRQFSGGLFGHFPNDFSRFPNVPSIEPKPFEEERKDKDLDDSSGKVITSLLKESPSYQEKSAQPPVSSSRFHSTSIVRIRRPDGVIEETRKYRDSNGREETEIITHEPGSEGSTQPVDPFIDQSFSSSFFKRFSFSIF